MKKTIVITGATDGIGRVCAHSFAKNQDELILIGRNPDKLAALVYSLQVTGATVHSYVADLSSAKETFSLTETIRKDHPKIDVLLNNAGAYFDQYSITKEGLESTFALNHLNYFILTLGLLPSLKKAGESRIVNVASRAHMGVSLDFDNLLGEKEYSGWKQYQRSKLMNIYFTYELAERLSQTKITVNCLHPGFVKTKFGQNNDGLAKIILTFAQNIFAISEEKGAETSIFLVNDPTISSISGKYFVKKEIQKSSEPSYDVTARRKLWSYTEELLKSKFNFKFPGF
ncbi:SDR family oxidoreductase [Leptospira sp. 2 VSF19]|uniref:SDR family oxidoreductase n=1 Tax=Leptospira soteropolitanensis TaxID=2950025 RepID=A0AAW5VPF2_9LEPT|nr:SDR family oxidoreductase [Leptospira soteropolitanensis]MCW7493425.1 SDR family oxidoreductase [Leptospira soteropolitanensis]MCW7501043.1 SDR family oxidoreductase [Leptospira soteropolitanensis]MCW7523277.1 SDR family oxidoreductase [Leptospira soteropolitanensis]MCW7527138.1 SDR family oxidoreductase [Leptospira soteropolitanensis]MCW7530995.1 SDR family oxidoreductase [Leptospira soteropolitanensis]